MARKQISVDQKIELQKEIVAKTKTKYEAALLKLETMQKEREAIQNKELLKAISKSSKSYEEIISFLNEDDSEG